MSVTSRRRSVGRSALVAACSLSIVLVMPEPADGQVEDVASLVRAGYEKRQAGQLDSAIALFRRAVTRDSANTQARLHLGYALLAADRVLPGIEQFRAITRMDPGNVLAHRQLALLLSARGEYAGARAELEAVRALDGLQPTDWLELGRVQHQLGAAAASRSAFERALATGDSTVRAEARAALAGVTSASRPIAAAASTRGGFVELYSAPLYQSRFDLVTAQGAVRVGVLPLGAWRWTPYLSLRVVTDTRSNGGVQGLRYSENVAVPALGARLQPLGGRLTIYGETGPAFPVVREDRGRRPRTDGRVGAYLYDAWRWGGATATTPLARRLELYADANYLHRFDDDVFASVQTRGVLELLHTAAGSLEAFTRMSAVGDRRRFPWANVGEGSVGVTIVPGRARRFVVMAEQVGGVYLRERPVPGQSGYGDFRVTGVVYFYSRLGH